MEENDHLFPENKRPFFLSILCFSVFVYSAVFILLFLAVASFSNWIRHVLIDFFPEAKVEKSTILWLAISGLILYSLSFMGAIFIWRMKRIGFIIYVVASITIASIPFLFGFGSIINAIVFSALIIAFAFFYRKLN
jgi:hypothetical protein